MPKKTSMYLPDWLPEYLASYGEENPLSPSVVALIQRYRSITADACPEFTEQEWSAICDVLNGCGVWLSDVGRTEPAQHIWAELLDSGPDGIAEKWGVNLADLAKRIRALPLAGKVAVWDVAAKFWADPQLNQISTLDLLKKAGAKIKEK